MTGFTDIYELEKVFDTLNWLEFTMERPVKPMVGFLASRKTFEGETPGRRSPDAETLGELLLQVRGRALPTIHYFSRSPDFASEVRDLLDWLGCRAVSKIFGIQLNLNNPTSAGYQQLRDWYPSLKLIFQYHTQIGIPIADIATQYSQVDYFLVDSSRGRGLPLDSFYCAGMFERISGRRTIFAGGLGPYNVREAIERLLGSGIPPIFCLDAESLIRSGDDSFIDNENVERYLKGAMQLWKHWGAT